MNNYNNGTKTWTGAERQESYKLTMKAISDGIITDKSKKVCERCGQEHGLIMLHNNDYDVTLMYLGAYYNRGWEITPEALKKISEALEEMCWRCHMIHHSIRRNPTACALYWEQIARGKQFPPVYKHDFNILKKEHGI